MSRNANSHFALNPTSLDIPRSTFTRNSEHFTSCNVGELIPIYFDEVLPGDTFQIKSHKVIRLETLLTPMMGNIYLDTFWFFVPMRLTWEHTKEFFGENTKSAWLPNVEYSIPQIEAPTGGWEIGTVADHFGMPVLTDNISVSALPFRAYSLIVNEWFRDQNLQDPLLIPLDDSTRTGVNTGNQVTDCALGGKPFIAAKFHDYFTSALPAPQKGPAVTLPMQLENPLPVIPLDTTKEDFRILWEQTGNNYARIDDHDALGEHGAFAIGKNYRNDNLTYVGDPLAGDAIGDGLNFYNLFAYPNGNNFSSVTINEMRLAFQIQKLFERDARGGTRYRELIKSHFGVTSPDARMQIPEYLGGNRIPIHISQIIQQSATGSGDTPQGTVTGMSLTTDQHDDFIKSFTEHGFLIGLCVARYDHSYQQGINRAFSRKTRLDYYWPAFAHIGEQAIKNKEIFAGTAKDEEVFGYQEAFAEYRYKPSIVTGEMRSNAPQSLDIWHLADDYDTLPRLSADWIREDKNTVDRVLAVSSEVSNQLRFSLFFEETATRPMPMYSIPGLIDHF